MKKAREVLPLFLLCTAAALLWSLLIVRENLSSSLARTPQVPTRSFAEISLDPVMSTHIDATPKPTPLIPSIASGEKGLHVPVLLYHYISVNLNKADTARTALSTLPSVLEKQLQLLRDNGFTTITFDELAAALHGNLQLPVKPVILTFDDGYSDFYFNAYPLLKKYNMKGVEFIPTGLIGGSLYMTWAQIEEMSKSPNVVFGAHSVHHAYLPKISKETLVREVVESKSVLEQHVGYTINWFAYPYGAFNDTVVAEVKKAGFIGAITTLPGATQYGSRFFYIPRYRAGNRQGADLLKLLSG